MLRSVKAERQLADYLREIAAPNFLFLYMLAGNVDRRTMGEILIAVRKGTKYEKDDTTNPQIKPS